MAIEKGTGYSVENFSLPDSEGKELSLADLTKQNKVVLLFFPQAFSDVCTEELNTVKNNMKLYTALKTNVAAISVDSVETLRKFKKANNLNFPLLSDFNKEVSEQMGVLSENYLGLEDVSKRAVFLINVNHQVEYSEVIDNPKSLPDFKALQKAIL